MEGITCYVVTRSLIYKFGNVFTNRGEICMECRPKKNECSISVFYSVKRFLCASSIEISRRKSSNNSMSSCNKFC